MKQFKCHNDCTALLTSYESQKFQKIILPNCRHVSLLKQERVMLQYPLFVSNIVNLRLQYPLFVSNIVNLRLQLNSPVVM